MIQAAEQRWFKWVWRQYLRFYQLPRHFSALRMRGQIDPPQMNGLEKPPVIYIANHTSWWDGFVSYECYQPRSKYSHFTMMEEENLRKFQFFRKIGVFSIDKSRQAAIMESLNYAVDLLHKGNAVWIFPQGKIEHLEKRPLQFFSGVAYMLQKCPQAVVIPVTIYYFFGSKQKPESSVWFGSPVAETWTDYDRKQVTEKLQSILERQLDEHREQYMQADGPDESFQTIVTSSATDERFMAAKRWVKAWFGRSRR